MIIIDLSVGDELLIFAGSALCWPFTRRKQYLSLALKAAVPVTVYCVVTATTMKLHEEGRNILVLPRRNADGDRETSAGIHHRPGRPVRCGAEQGSGSGAIHSLPGLSSTLLVVSEPSRSNVRP